MKSVVVFVSSVFVSAMAFAVSPYEEQITGILQDASSTNRIVRLNATNRIDSLLMVLSNRNEIATCKLLLAKLRMECADIANDDSAYDANAYRDATNLCWNVLHDFEADRSTWPFYGASLLLPLPLSIDKRYGDMLFIATNALSSIEVQNAISIDTNVWTVLFGPEMLQQSNLTVSFRVLAASSLLLSDSAADVSAYTNGLPTEALSALMSIP